MDNTSLPVKFSQRAISWLIISTLVWQPMAPAVAAAISPTGPASMDKAANGVPVLNIATPNGAGISHNQFKDYNVGKEGLILNNATGQLNQTQLGGIIQNNPNLRAGQEARGIINEVTGGSRSQLQGYTEVAGKAANVIVANPYGISCDGCGFINTPNATLTTGKPQFDAKGNLSALNVTGGTITVEGKGLDASHSDALSIISRATDVNAAIHAKDLKVIAGANRVGADGSVTAIEGEGPAPTVAVDTGALGGMYANRIHLVSSEKGVGVNLGNLTARQGDITLDASGKLVLNNSLSGGALTVKATSAELSGDNKAAGAATVTAQNGIALKQGSLVSDKTVSLDAGEGVDITHGKVTAGENIRLAGTGLAIDKASTADAAGSIDLNTAGTLDNAGQLTAGQAMTLNAGAVSNTGSLAAKGRLDATGKTLDNQGTLSAGGDVGLHVDDRIHNDGSILADGTLEATTGELVQDGKLSGRKGVTAKSDTLSSGKDAQTLSEGDITVNAQRTADIAGEVNAGGALALNSGTLNTDTTARLQGQNVDLIATKATLNGTQAAKQALNVKADTLAHGGKSSAEKVTLKAADTLNNSGTITATDLALEGESLTNSGLFQGTGSLSLQADRLDNRASGSIHTLGDFALNLPDFTNSGLLSVGGQLQLDGNHLINSGQITAGQLNLNIDALNNLNGAALLSDGQLPLTAGALANDGILQGGGLNLTADSWRNDGVALSAQGATVRVNGTLSNNGKILGQQGLDMTADSMDNTGQVVAKVLALHGDLVNSGLLQGDDSLALTGQVLTNSAGGQMLSAGNTTLDAGTLDNRGELQANTLDVTAGDWTNSGTTRATDSLMADLSGKLNNSGTLRSALGLDLNAAEIANSGILAADRLSLSAPQLSNSGILQGKSALTLSTDTLNNLNGGELLSGKGLSLTLDSLQNDGLLHVGGTFDLKARELANGGTLQADRLTLDIGDSLVNNAGAELLAKEDATLKAKHLDNAGTLAANSLNVSGDTLTNRGTLQGDSVLTATFDNLTNQADGMVVSGGHMTVTSGDVSNDGQAQAQVLELNADSLQNSGRLMADSLTLEANSLQNQGLLQGNSALSARGNNTLEQSADGRMLTNGTLTLSGGKLTTDGKLQGQQVTLDADDWQHKGTLIGGGSLLATVANQLVNDGDLMSLGDMQLNAAEQDNRGDLLSSGDITLGGTSLKNSGSVQGLTLALTQGQVTNSGKLIGIDALTVAAPAVTGRMMRTLMAQPERELRNEQGGSMLTRGDLTLHSDNVINNGSWQGQNILLSAQRLNNDGEIQSAGDMQLVLGDSLTSGADSKIVANGTAALEALTLTNQGEWVAGNLALKASTLTNGGTVSGVNGLTLDLRDGLTQQQGSILETGGALALTIDDLENQGRIQAGSLAITGNKLTNSGTLQGDNGLFLTMRDSLTNTASGSLLSGKGVTLAAPELINYGLIQGGDASTLTATDSVRNDGKILNDGALTVTAPALANNGMLQATNLILGAANIGNNGTLLGSDALNVTAQQINQQAAGKLLSGGNLMLSSNGFDQLGQVVALGDATLNLVNSFNGRGTLAAGKKLNVSSKGDLTNSGVMQGEALELSADGVLLNNGTLTAGNGASTLTGSRIEMGSTGSLQGGGNIDLISRSDITLNGFTGSGGTLTLSAPGTIVNTAMLYAANNLWLLADNIKNQGGNILAGDSLWMQRDKAGTANSEILNTSGTIETTNGDITLKTGHLLNQWESIDVGETKTESIASTYGSVAAGTVALPLSLFKPEDLIYYFGKAPVDPAFVKELGFHIIVTPMPASDDQIKEVAVSRITSSTTVTGQAGRISSGKNLDAQVKRLDNLGSYILAGKSLNMTGELLNNQSYISGTQTVWRIFTLANSYNVFYTEKAKSDSNLKKYDEIDGSEGVGKNPDGTINPGPPSKNRLVQTINYTATDNYRTEQTSSIRGVIQANGDTTTRFGAIENNSESTDVRGTIVPTLTRPGLQTLVQQTLNGEIEGAELTEFQPIAVNSPQWRDQLQNALQQVNGGGTLDTQDGHAVSLDNHPQGSINYTADGTATVLNANPWQQNQQATGQQGKPFDTSAYPLPQGDNGYFTVSDKSDSPYLITINPKLNGLGELDKNVYGDLYQLLNMQPDAVPLETRQQYTDKGAFLGSAYFLDRLNLKPEYDYRILGDAVFDTRYVSNAVLSQTGNRYINGMGSDLDQMKYLMDNAAAAQQSLGLQAGVTLTADQIASLDRSILWWEAATINGQTVLVPKLYLAAGDVTINNGSVIAGNNVTIDGDSVSNNGSTLLAKQGMTIESQAGIDNRNASLIKAGEGLQLSAVGDINNIGSAISGKQVALESLEGDINNLTLTTQTRHDSRWNRSQFTEQDEKATIGALDLLSLNAGKNINMAGSTLRSGGDTVLKAESNIDILANNTGTIFDSGRQHYKSTSSAASTLESGGRLDITAGNDLRVQASNIDGAKGVSLTAGNDLNLLSVKNSVQDNNWKKTYSETIDSTTLTSGDGLSLTSGRDLNSQAAGMAAEGDVSLKAGRDITLQSEATRNESYSGSGGNREIKKTVRQQGTEIAAGGDIAIQAGGDLTSNAAQVVAQQDIAVSAGENVNFNTATESDYYYKETTKKKKSLLSTKTTVTIQEDSATREKGTLLSGTNVSVEAGKNILVNGSQVVGDEEVALKAGDNIDILAATNTNSSWRFSETKKSGLMGSGGIGFTIGSSKTTHDLKQKGTTQSQSVSTVGSTGGNVTIASGGQVHLNGSDVVAGKGITVDSDNVLVTAGHDKNITDEIFKQKTAGLTLALSGTVGDAINSAVSAAQSASEQSDSRLAALQGAKAALSGYQAAQAVRLDAANGSDPSNGATVGIMLSLGAQSSKSQSHSEQDTTRSATLNAGNNLTLTANGKGQKANSGDINVEGGQLKAGQDVTLDAARDITLQAAKDTQMMTGSNSSKGGSIGVGLTAGSGGTGITVSASVNASKGNQKGNGTSWNETNIDAGNQVTLNSGRDTALTGALVNGDKVVADVGRDLTVASLQDSNNYDSKQQSVSAGASFTWGVPGGSASFSYSRDKMKSTYDSVQEQSGIYAGKGGFDITVGSHTQLDGAVLSSTADAEKNRLDTGTLGFSDIHNEADYKVEHQGVGISTSGSMAMQGAMNLANNLLASAGGSGHAEGTTQAAVADGTITVRDQANQKQDVTDLSRDTANANGAIGQIFDKEKEQKRLQAAQMIGELGSQMAQVARTEGQIAAITAGKAELAKNNTPEPDAKDTKGWEEYNKKLIATPAYKDAMDQWGTGSTIQRAIQATTAAVQGLAGGDVAAALAGGAAPFIANVIGQAIPEDNLLGRALAHATVNAALAAAQGKDMGVAAAGAATGEIAAAIATASYGKTVSELTESEKQTVSALATLASALAGGLIGDSGATAIAGAQVGKTTAENNLLGDKSSSKLDELIKQIQKGDRSLATLKKLLSLENADARSNALMSIFKKDPTALSSTEQAELNSYVRIYAAEMGEKYGTEAAQRLVISLFADNGYERTANSGVMKLIEPFVNTWGYHESNARIGDAALAYGFSPLGSSIKTGVLGNAAIGAGVNAAGQLIGNDPFSYVDVVMAAFTSGASTGKGWKATAAINMGGAAVGSGIKGEDPIPNVIISGLGSIAGSGTGKITSFVLSPYFKEGTVDILGNIGSSSASETLGYFIKGQHDEAEKPSKK